MLSSVSYQTELFYVFHHMRRPSEHSPTSVFPAPRHTRTHLKSDDVTMATGLAPQQHCAPIDEVSHVAILSIF